MPAIVAAGLALARALSIHALFLIPFSQRGEGFVVDATRANLHCLVIGLIQAPIRGFPRAAAFLGLPFPRTTWLRIVFFSRDPYFPCAPAMINGKFVSCFRLWVVSWVEILGTPAAGDSLTIMGKQHVYRQASALISRDPAEWEHQTRYWRTNYCFDGNKHWMKAKQGMMHATLTGGVAGRIEICKWPGATTLQDARRPNAKTKVISYLGQAPNQLTGNEDACMTAGRPGKRRRT